MLGCERDGPVVAMPVARTTPMAIPRTCGVPSGRYGRFGRREDRRRDSYREVWLSSAAGFRMA